MSSVVDATKESFDAALLPGIRERLAEAYRSLRQSEQDVFQSVLDENGVFREGIAHIRDCPLCGTSSKNSTGVYDVHGMHVVRCGTCDLVYSREVIHRHADNARYRRSHAMDAHMVLHTNEAYAALESAKARYIVANLRKAIGKEGISLLDIGCSTGSILKAAGEVGWRALGVDPNSAAVKIARTRGLEAVEGYFPEAPPARLGLYQAITMLDVLEHAEDPVSFLVSVAERLVPGGVLGVQVPNLNSLLIRLEGARNNNICHGHWSYFTSETLTKVAAKAGLQVSFVETFISEIDRIQAHPTHDIVEAARMITGKQVELADIDHRWIHEHMLGYKLFGIFVKRRP